MIKQMTVSELIEKLSKFPPDKIVIIKQVKGWEWADIDYLELDDDPIPNVVIYGKE